MKDTWIWLPQSVYPNYQITREDAICGKDKRSFTVAEFCKKYSFDREITSVSVRFSGDTDVQLYCNGRQIGTGPSSVGGDFLGNGVPRGWYYADGVSFEACGKELSFFARVKMCPTRGCDYSKGHGGFMLSARVVFADGSAETVSTDGSWLVRRNGAFEAPRRYDGRIAPDDYIPAEVIPDLWNAEQAPIPVREEREIVAGVLRLAAGEETEKVFPLDMIYAAFLQISAKSEGTVFAEISMKEMDENVGKEQVILRGDDSYRGFHLDSVGNLVVHARNEGSSEATVTVGVIATCYPVTVEARTETDDGTLNRVLDLCRHTLRYCRQTLHLDSPRHCEPLACTGDYYIESLMTSFSFGDMRLAEFDVERTAQLLRHNDGRMFHTSYSLIWVRMLHDVYWIGGNFSLLEKCRDALDLLLARFASYVGENGLIETPPDYMFVDWIYIDGLSMHHPPKALGQSVLNMLYYMAQSYGERIYALLGEEKAALRCKEGKERTKAAVNSLLYDEEKGMYFEGLNTPIPETLINQWQPRNVEKRYYLKHSNIMAAYTSVCDGARARMLLDKIMNEEIEGIVQPYFQHYLLDAIYTHGLREKYTLAVVNRWKPALEVCDKGLVEGFFPPEPTYHFDHSHAWGGSPLYSLPKALIGLEILEPGYRKIRLNPSLLGLERARVEVPTPFGTVVCEMKRGEEVKISAPSEISVETVR